MNSPIVIGIAGGSGSGKTTLSRKIYDALTKYKVELIEMDRFYKHERVQSRSPFSNQVYEDFDHPDSIDSTSIQQKLSLIMKSGTSDIVIIEGFMLFHFETLKEMLDIKVYVDCPPDERLLRRVSKLAGWGIQEEDYSDYLQLIRTRHEQYVEPCKWHADIICNGLSQTSLAVDLISCYVSKQKPLK
ncbi:AAA family ATPase [Paenibacillus gansuensis]|uniref:AAA family ATPase n=1 Tax=Paenibacillus gansuensis TaxID=306542 RepID=A0ABW5PDS0_9BACL